MESIETRIRTALVVLGQAAPTVANLLNGAISSFSGHPAIAEALADVEFKLTELGQNAVESALPGTELADTLASVRRTYTMESERRIHDTMWGRPQVAPVAAAAADDDLGLLDAPTANAESSSDDGDVLFF